jgi:hypothetical protein
MLLEPVAIDATCVVVARACVERVEEAALVVLGRNAVMDLDRVCPDLDRVWLPDDDRRRDRLAVDALDFKSSTKIPACLTSTRACASETDGSSSTRSFELARPIVYSGVEKRVTWTAPSGSITLT